MLLHFPLTVDGSFPAELNFLVDFVADDDRPILILNHATTQVLYCNNAFNALLTTDCESSSTPSWLTSLLEAACYGTRPSPRTTETLPTFADRSWSRKSIGTSWTAVSCLGQVHYGSSPAVAAVHEEDFEAVNQIWISAIEKGTAASAEFRVRAACSEHEVRWLEISAQQRHNKEGNLEYLYVWLRDISSRKQLAEQKLQDALETKRRSEVFIDMYELGMNTVTMQLANIAQDISRDA
jgi:PAS domain-containing protein